MEEKKPVDLTAEQAAEALDLSTWTILHHIREDAKGEEWFPDAYLLHNSRRLGYRIPERDVLAYAEKQGEWLASNAGEVIERARTEQLEAFNKRMEERRKRRRRPELQAV